VKLLDASTPLAMDALQAIAAEGLGRQLSEQDKSCMVWASQVAQKNAQK